VFKCAIKSKPVLEMGQYMPVHHIGNSVVNFIPALINIYYTQVTEHIETQFWKLFLRMTQPGTAFWNLLFLGSV